MPSLDAGGSWRVVLDEILTGTPGTPAMAGQIAIGGYVLVGNKHGFGKQFEQDLAYTRIELLRPTGKVEKP